MCGIAAVLNLSHERVPGLPRAVAAMNELQRHRGADGEGTWLHPRGFVGLGHRRRSIFDLETGQPVAGECGLTTYSVTRDAEGTMTIEIPD